MALWSRRRRRSSRPYAALTDEERMSRYVYLLSTLPPSVVEHAHKAAFDDLPEQKRRAMFDELRPFMSEEERRGPAEPSLLARVVGRVNAAGQGGDADSSDRRGAPFLFRDAGIMPAVALYFLTSQSVTSYFAVGAGSLGLASEPAWVGDLASGGPAGIGPGEAGFGFDSGSGGFDGGGFGGFAGGDVGGGF